MTHPAETPAAEPALAGGASGALSHGRALLIITLLTTPLLLMFLGTGDPMDMMELFNLIPIREAYRDGHWLLPTLNGSPRLEKPPLPVWIPAAFAKLSGSDSLWILRLPSLLMALLTGIATYGIGCILFKNPADRAGGHKTERYYAVLAALLLPSMLIFNRQARLASYDIYATAFLTCGAYFLLVMAERGKTPGERVPRGAAWLVMALVAGVCTGLSILSKGPVPAATVMLPLGLWLLLFHRRAGIWVGVLLAAMMSLLAFLPWLIAIGGLPGASSGAWIIEPLNPEVRNAWTLWRSEFIQFGTGHAASVGAGTKAQLTDPPYYYLQMIVWVLPLTPSLIAGLVLPFLKSQGDPAPSDRERRGRWLLWLVLVLGLVLLTVPSEKKTRYALQLFPYAALLCAAAWQEFVRFPPPAERAKVDPAGALVLASQALFFIVPGLAGLLATLWIGIAGSFPKWPVVATAIRTAGISWALLLFVLLTLAGVYLWRLLVKRRFARGAAMLAVCAWWMVLTLQCVYKGLPETHTNPAREPTEAAVRAAGGAPILTLQGYRPWLPTLFFANRILPGLNAHEVGTYLTQTFPPSPPPSPGLPRIPAAGGDVYLMLITDTFDGKAYTRMAGLEAALAVVEQQTGREAEEVAHWLDENRRTALFRLSAPQASTRSQ